MKATMTIASRTAIATQVVFATLFIETSVPPASIMRAVPERGQTLV
jgi:hypothetical protein